MTLKLRQACTQQLRVLHANLHRSHVSEKGVVLHRAHAENFSRHFVAHVFGTCLIDAHDAEITQRVEMVESVVQMVSSCWALQIRCVTLREACPTAECVHCMDEQIRANLLLFELEQELELCVCSTYDEMYERIVRISHEVKGLTQTMEETPLHDISRCGDRVLAPIPFD
jgi:hypothetical protein